MKKGLKNHPKRICMLAVAGLIALSGLLASCSSDDGESENDALLRQMQQAQLLKAQQEQKEKDEQAKKAARVFSELKGEWVETTGSKMVIGDSTISLDLDKTYSEELRTLNKTFTVNPAKDYVIIDKWLCFSLEKGYALNYYGTDYKWEVPVSFYQDGVEKAHGSFKPVKSSSSGGNNGTASITSANNLTGKYSFSEAVKPQVNGSFTLSGDGKWTYSGDKQNPAATSGTWSVSGGKITLKWTAKGYEVSETFTVEEDGNKSEWKSESSVVSNFLSMLFGVADTKLTFKKS